MSKVFNFQRDIHLTLLGVIVGILGGLIGFVFRESIELLDELLFGKVGFVQLVNSQFGYLACTCVIIMIPTIGGLFVGYLTWNYFPMAKGHGIGLEMMYLEQGHVNSRKPLGKFITTILSLGTGFSGGPEGPIATVTGGVGSLVGQMRHQKQADLNILIAAGAAAGIGAVFNAPLGGAIFAMELMIAAITPHIALPILISSASSVMVISFIEGSLKFENTFLLAQYSLQGIEEIPFIVIFGLLCGVFGILFQYSLFSTEDELEDIKNRFNIWPPLLTATGGLIIGIFMAFISLDIHGTGHNTLNGLLLGTYWSNMTLLTGILLILLALAKIFATAISLGSGASAGVFAPCLFIGAAFGAGYAITLNAILNSSLNPLLYALLGFAAVFAACARAPLTMIIITVELTANFSLLPGILLTVIIAFILHLVIMDESIYTEKLKRFGISSTARTADELLNFITVEEVMHREPVAILSTTPVSMLQDIVIAYKHIGYPVIDNEGHLVGMVDLLDMRHAVIQQKKLEDTTIASIMNRNVHYGTLKMTVQEAMDTMYQYVIDKLPIVIITIENKLKLVGIFTQGDIINSIEIFHRTLEHDRNIVTKNEEYEVINPIIELIPSKYHHLEKYVFIVAQDVISEAEEYMKRQKIAKKA